MKTLLCLLTALYLLCGAATPNLRPGGKDYALFIAVEEYDNSGAWDSLPGLIQECKDINLDLISLYGFSDESKVLENPTLIEIKAELAAWRSRSYDPDDQLLIFFSGHGKFLEDLQEGFFIPRDGRPSSDQGAEQTWYSLLQLPRHINTIPCRHIVLTLDACYSGAIFNQEKHKTETEPWETSKKAGEAAFNQHVHNLLASKSRILMTSGGKVRTKHPSDFVKYFRQTLAVHGGKDGILHAYEFENYWPVGALRPMMGTFEGHEPGGDFLFVYQPHKEEEGISLYCKNTLEQIDKQLIKVEGGRFQMGTDFTMGNVKFEDTKPIHEVEISSFFLSRYEVTIGQYVCFCEATDSCWPEWLEKGKDNEMESGDDFIYKSAGMDRNSPDMPVTGISWNDAVSFCKWLTDQTGKNYRLPTEAEWEFAARGGNESSGYKFAGGNELVEVGWYWQNSGNEFLSGEWSLDKIERYKCKVSYPGQKKPNELGLYDMSGNVWEWCSDWYLSDYYQKNVLINPKGADSGNRRVCRGGAWYSNDFFCLTGFRYAEYPSRRLNYIGFRIACENQ